MVKHGELQSLFALGAEGSSSEDESCLDDCNRPTAEIQSFLKLKILRDKHMVCEWWEGNKSQFPLLYNFAAKYLAILATSASSERSFSKAGSTIGKLRTRLTGQHIDEINVLHCNSSLL